MIADERRSIIWWDWVGDHLDDIWQRTVEHVQLTIIAIVVGLRHLVRARPCSPSASRWTYRPITRMASILYTIPSIALFALLIPFTGLGILTAEIALVSYTILILVGNTVAGLDAVPDVGQGSRRRHGVHPVAPAPHRRGPARPADDHRRYPDRHRDGDRARHDRRADRHRRIRRAHQRRTAPQLSDPDRDRRHAVDLFWRCSSTVVWRSCNASSHPGGADREHHPRRHRVPHHRLELDGRARDPRSRMGPRLDLVRRRDDLRGRRHPCRGLARPQDVGCRHCRWRWSTSAGRSRRSRSSPSSSRSASGTGSASASGPRVWRSSRSASRRCSRTRMRG